MEGTNGPSSYSTFTFAESGRASTVSRDPPLLFSVADHDAVTSRKIVLDDHAGFHFLPA